MNYTTDPQVAIDAKKLAAYTIQVTGNTNNFPKKYRFTLVNHIVNVSLGIYSDIVDANSYTGRDRIRMQTAAIAKCRKLRGYLEIAQDAVHPACNILYWARMVSQIETQLLNWRRATK